MAGVYETIKDNEWDKTLRELINNAYHEGYEEGRDSIEETFDRGYTEGYEEGMNNAWKVADEIINGYWITDLEKMGFGSITDNNGVPIDSEEYCMRIFTVYTAFEAERKIHEYKKEEEKRKQDSSFRVGDEVKADITLRDGKKAIVTKLFEDDINVLWEDGETGCYEKERFIKTGSFFNLNSIFGGTKE